MSLFKDAILVQAIDCTDKLDKDIDGDVDAKVTAQVQAYAAAIAAFNQELGGDEGSSAGLRMRWKEGLFATDDVKGLTTALSEDYSGAKEHHLWFRFSKSDLFQVDTKSDTGFPLSVAITPENMQRVIDAINQARVQAVETIAIRDKTSPETLGLLQSERRLMAKQLLAASLSSIDRE